MRYHARAHFVTASKLSPTFNFILWVLVLAALLFYPVSKLIWVFSVRRLQRKLERALSEEELQGQLKRARIIAVFTVIVFSWLYNLNTIGFAAGG